MGLSIIDSNIKSLVDRFGQTLKVYPGRLCSCVGENNGLPILNHECNLGFYYGTPETVIGIRTQVSYKLLIQPQGRIYNGGATFTIPRYRADGTEQTTWKTIAHGDIIVIENKIRRDTDVLVKGVRDSIYAFDVVEILNIFKNNVQYLPTIDFTTTLADTIAGKLTNIVWVTGKGPADKESYTVEFTCNQQYKVWDDGAQDRGTDVDDLPKKVVGVLRRYVVQENSKLEDLQYNEGVY